jgi:hypothetical protein
MDKSKLKELWLKEMPKMIIENDKRNYAEWLEDIICSDGVNKFCNLHIVSGSASASDNDPQIDYHLRRVKAVNHYIKDKGNLAARVFLRATGAINNHNGTFTMQEQDIKAWFESGSHLTAFTEYDTM